MTTDNTQPFDLDSLIDGQLEDLADMPVFAPFPNGAHKVTVDEFKIDRERGSIQVKMTYVELMELASPEDKAPVKGDKQVQFIRLMKKDKTANEFGQGELKIWMTGLAEGGFKGKNGEIMEAAKGAEVIILTKLRKQKDPQYQDQMQVEGVSVA